MMRTFRIFFGSEGANPWIVCVCLLAASIGEGLSIASLLPILTLAQSGDTGGKFKFLFGDMLEGVSFDAAISGLLLIRRGFSQCRSWLSCLRASP